MSKNPLRESRGVTIAVKGAPSSSSSLSHGAHKGAHLREHGNSYTMPEDHPACTAWILQRLHEELGVNTDTELTIQHREALSEFMVGNTNYSVLFAYYIPSSTKPISSKGNDQPGGNDPDGAFAFGSGRAFADGQNGSEVAVNDGADGETATQRTPSNNNNNNNTDGLQLMITLDAAPLVQRERSRMGVKKSNTITAAAAASSSTDASQDNSYSRHGGAGRAHSHACDVLYLVRLEPDRPLFPETMDQTVMWGVCRGANLLDSFLRFMRTQAMPVMLYSRWPTSIEKDVHSALHRFMASMVELINRLKGCTVLYVPGDLAGQAATEAHADRELVQRYEATVIHWTRQIKEVVGREKAAGSSLDDAGPLDEIHYWRDRAHDLGNIRMQLNRPDVASIVNVLRETKSFYYLEPFFNLRADIEKGSEEAFDNLRFLRTLVEPCERLVRATPKEIPALIPSILVHAQLVLIYSRHYKRDQFARLLRMISNEIIRRCSLRINTQAILAGQVTESMAALQDSVRAGEAWMRECRRMIAATQLRFREEKGEKLELDDSFLNEIDGFVRHRCQNLQEICRGQLQFGFGTIASAGGGSSDEGGGGGRRSAALPRRTLAALDASARASRRSSAAHRRRHDSSLVSLTGGRGEGAAGAHGSDLHVAMLDDRVYDPAELFRNKLPLFGGHRGLEIESQLLDIQRAFHGKMEMLHQLDYDLLDIKSTKWVDDFRVLKADMNNLSTVMRQIITAAFDSVATVATGAEYIEAFYRICIHEELLIQLDRSKDRVYRLFLGELRRVQNSIQRYFDRHPPLFYLHPPYAGHGLWAQQHVALIAEGYEALRRCYYLPCSPDKDEADRMYDRLERALREMEHRLYTQWRARVPPRPADLLDRPILALRVGSGAATRALAGAESGSTITTTTANAALTNTNTNTAASAAALGESASSRPGLFDVNFAPELLLLLEEVRYWQSAGKATPGALVDMVSREERLRVFRENVAVVVRSYNAVVLALDSSAVRLFSLRLQFLMSKYTPGLSKLRWNSLGVVEYFIRDCRSHAERVQRVVDRYHHTHRFVDHHCRLIAESSAVVFEPKKVYTMEGFVERQRQHRAATVRRLRVIYNLIVDALYELFDFFRDDYASDETVRREWHHFMDRVELKLEAAFRSMVKRSLTSVEKALPKESSEERLDERVFRLDVVIEVVEEAKPVIQVRPSVEELGRQMNETCKAILGVVRGFDRLEAALRARLQQAHTEEGHGASVTSTEANAIGSSSSSSNNNNNNNNNNSTAVVAVRYEKAHHDDIALRGSYYEYMTGDQDAILSLRRVHDTFVAIAGKVREKLEQTWQLHQSATTDNLWATQRQDRRIKQGWKLKDYEINMAHVAERRDGMDKQEVYAEVLYVQLDFTQMKETFRAQCQLIIRHYHGLLYAEAKSELDRIYAAFDDTLAALTQEPSSLTALEEQTAGCRRALAEAPDWTRHFAGLTEKFAFLTSEAADHLSSGSGGGGNSGAVDRGDVRRCEELPDAHARYVAALQAAKTALDGYHESFQHDVETSLRGLQTQSFALHEHLRDAAPVRWLLTTEAALEQLAALAGRAAELRAAESALQHGIRLFGLEAPELADLAAAEATLAALSELWALVQRWRRVSQSWRTDYFMQLNSEGMLDELEQIRRAVLQRRTTMECYDVWVQLREDILLMRRVLPIIDDLRTPAIRPRHWELLKMQLLCPELDTASTCFNLQQLLDAHVERQAEFIANLALAAREELKMETSLDKIRAHWEEARFVLEPYQGYHKIASVDDVQNALAEQLAGLSAMKMSRFVDSFRVKVLQWEQTLSTVTDTIDILLTVQTKWMYLENIFVGSEDIKRKLVVESRKFDIIHGQWLAILTRLMQEPNVVRSTRRDHLLDNLHAMNADLERIQKSLESFLEERRRVFPRFYFLSNDDLLEILGHTKDPDKVQPHLRKCFEGLHHLTLRPAARGRVFAEAMSSADGETVSLVQPIAIDGVTVETWLRWVEQTMRSTVRRCVNVAWREREESVFDPTRPHVHREALRRWIAGREGQALITASCIHWTRQTERAIVDYGRLHAGGLSLHRRKTSPLYRVYKQWKGIIRKYCQLVRQPQTRLQRNKLVALITIEVHNRDILRHVLASRVYQLDNFEWSRQLRFYGEEGAAAVLPSSANGAAGAQSVQLSHTLLDPPRLTADGHAQSGVSIIPSSQSPPVPPSSSSSSGTGGGGHDDAPAGLDCVCVVRQTSARVLYDYEYLGNSGRLVVTGLTDRAYMTLTTALQLFRGGLPQGPAGTGKTETVKDLGKAIGKYVMVFNCSDGLDYRSVGRMLSGIAQTGAWSCFDEFNRIEVEVLSVVAQQILSILTAVSEQRARFIFDGTEIPLNVNCGLFVTMNPGYAGRSELPDNLKALLRPISMMVPDFALICEITLLAEGFEESEGLSKKVSLLYELMEKQLSKQDHYDFSLRNIKAVLVQAGNLKREGFVGTESQLCLKAMRDMNLPKFVKDDVPLFLGMLGDLFPGVGRDGKKNNTSDDGGGDDEEDNGQRAAMRAAAGDDLTSAGLEVNDHIVTKALHLWDTLRTRHGVMMVGRTASGKTVTWRTLSGTLRRLKEAGVVGSSSNNDDGTNHKAAAAAPAEDMYESVRVSVLNPKSVTMEELYGSYNQATREWRDGILSDLMRSMCRDAEGPQPYKWLLFDGPVDTLWIESMNTVLDDNKMLTLNSGERIGMTPTVRMLFEVEDLSQASPATVSRCGMVYFNVEDLGWRPFVATWLRARRESEVVMNGPRPEVSVAELRDFVEQTVARVLDYRASECEELVPTTAYSTIRAFTQMFDALARVEAASVVPNGTRYQTHFVPNNKNNNNNNNNTTTTTTNTTSGSKDDPNEYNHTQYILQLRMVAMFCMIWSVGGSLTTRGRQKLDAFIREMDTSSAFPSTETVFEYFVDLSTMRWRSWEEHPSLQRGARYQPAANTPFHRQIVPTVDTVRYGYVVSQLVQSRVQLVLVGTTGTGKSLIAREVMAGLDPDTHVTTVLNFSAQTTARIVQDIIEGRMEHKSKKVCSPPGGRRMICLIEDLNMPAKEKFGAQPPLELLRQWMDGGFWYDRQTRVRRSVNDMQLLCCMTYGRPDISERLMSKLSVLNIIFPAAAVVSHIYTAILTHRFAPFPELVSYVAPVVRATVETYQRVSADLLPIPSKSHYLFNLRDLSKVFQGIYGAYLENLTCKEHVIALWLHECQRVFADRMNDEADQAWFRQLINDKLNNIFQTKLSNIMKARCKETTTMAGGGGGARGAHHPNASRTAAAAVGENEGPIFVDFWDGEYDEMAKYKLVPSMEALRRKVEEGLENYNAEPGARPMNLVFFTDALQHLCRIHRIMRQPRGNALLVGLGGSGRSSLTRLAAYLAGYAVFSIEIHKKYDLDRFHDDLRSLYRNCGVRRLHRVFYFSDNQIMDIAFLEDLNNMLSSGEVPNLFPRDDLQQIYDEVRKPALQQNYRDTADDLYNFFIDQARQHMHMVVAMSPAQRDFRARLRQFPALVSCTSIDWFAAWPNEALKEVGLRYLYDTRPIQTNSDDANGTDDDNTNTNTNTNTNNNNRNRNSNNNNYANGATTGGSASTAANVVDYESDAMLEKVCDMFVFMHDTTRTRARMMIEQLHRYYYVTPSSYMDLVRGFRALLAQKRREIAEQRDKLVNGMSKLQETKVTVSQMTEALRVQDAKLQEKSAEVAKATASIQVRQRIAEEQQTLVASEKIKIEQTKRAALVDQGEAQADLDRAMPTLLEAQAALDKLDKSDINEIKSYKTPAAMIRTVMEAVQTALHRKLDWDEAKKSISEPRFIDMLKTYHEQHDMTDQKLLNALEKYVRRNDFTPAAATAVSKAAGGLCQWVIAIYKYGNIYKEVHPKMVKNTNAQHKVRAQEEMLKQKEDKLQRIVDEVHQLELALQANVAEQNRLREEAAETQDKLNRARIIVDGLEGERDRWTASIARYDAALANLVGDTLLACGFLCYAGAFTADFRQALWLSWLQEMRRGPIAMDRQLDLVDFLVDPTSVREWQQAGLPGDDFSRENSAIVTRGWRYPLMIDPQQQAIRWVKAMERAHGLRVVDMKQPDFQKTVEQAVAAGAPLLLQDVQEEMDPILDGVMSKAVVRRGPRTMVKIGDNYVDYHPQFRLYLTTRLPNPHYTPETCTQVCLLNFAVKEQGLEEQLLKIVVEMEKPELEQENERLIVQTAAAQKETKRLEDEILDLLNNSQCSLLSNQRLIDTLQSAKVTAMNITTQLREAAATSEKIVQAREEYRPCARRASILFFVLADLGAIDAMYQFALHAYLALFRQSIRKSAEKMVSYTVKERTATLNNWHTGAVYNHTCRGLFERHKLLFAFHMTMRILQSDGAVNLEEYVFFLRGGQVLDAQGRLPNPAKAWLAERAWDHILELDKLTNFHGIADHFEQQPESWREWFLQERPEEEALPGEWAGRCGEQALQRMILVRSLRPDRLVFMIYDFIAREMGAQFVEPPPFSLKDTFDESTATTPLIFVLSAGVDPTSQLTALAQREGRRLRTLALGQGQGDNAKRSILESSQTGEWVFLANCHLMVSWLSELDKVIDGLAEQNPHRHFRLWLSSAPTPAFPIGILQRAIKMTTEPPKGIKANMLRLFTSFGEDDYAERSRAHPTIYHHLLYALCFFHSVLLERRKFGTLGYNVVYDFTTSDFEVSENIVQLYVQRMTSDRVEEVPFVTMRYLIAEASYGGRVTDDWDRRVLNTYMAQYMCPAAVREVNYALSSASEYVIPAEGNTVQSMVTECAQLPITDPPEAFGQHANADIASRIADSTAILDDLIRVNNTLVRGAGNSNAGGGNHANGSHTKEGGEGGSGRGYASSSSSGGNNNNGTAALSVEDRCREILQSLSESPKAAIPGLIDYDTIYEATNEDRQSALNTCLLQEIQRYNILLRKIHRQKAELMRAVKGEIVMSDELETIFDALLLGRVPPPWMSAYPSVKPLASWTVDLVARIEQMKAWGQRPPAVFWLSGFTYPTGFLKSLQQQQARIDHISIDQYDWEYAIVSGEERTIVSRPRSGAYIRGIYLEGAGWNSELSVLCEPRPMELIVHMPVIHFKPRLRTGKPKPASTYECPLYMYPIRTGTRERPSYVVTVDLDSGEAVPEHYTKRGTALLLSTND